MEYTTIISYVAASISLLLALFVLNRDRHSYVHRVFALGMGALAVEAFFTGRTANAIMLEDAAYWLGLRNYSTALVPGIWLLFSLSFSRSNYQELIARWKWVVLILFVTPFAIVAFGGHSFFIGRPILDASVLWVMRIGWLGYVFYLCVLAGAVLILMNLERTLRNSTGHLRWQIKFMILGIGCLFAVRIYTVSQTFLFHAVNLSVESMNNAAIIVAGVFIVKALIRTRLFNVNFYMSQTFIYNSITVLFVGLYLIAVGTLAILAQHFEWGYDIPFRAFFMLLALLGLVTLLFSDRLRRTAKRIISRHFQRPLYDYRKEWLKFTRSTASVTDITGLCDAVVRMVSTTFDTLSVTIWILDEQREGATLGASTVFTPGKSDEITKLQHEVAEFMRVSHQKNIPCDFDYLEDELPNELGTYNEEFFDNLRMRYCIPLITNERLLGVMMLGDRVGGSPLTVEDFDLLKTMSDQLAASLFCLILGDRLRQAKEMEAFQTMSAFFVHDLKNLASKLSLTMQNLPIHFDNPEFQRDALQSITQSVEKINLMSSRLTSLSQRIELNPITTDINEIVTSTLSSMDGSLGGKVKEVLQPSVKAMIDPEQIQKVLTNLILNADEATDEGATIVIATGINDGWVYFSVSDDGSGISEEFIEKSLFHPFRTTKQKGMGIGLYHSKTIVEAHNGKIEVESEEGKGTSFRVLLPRLVMHDD